MDKKVVLVLGSGGMVGSAITRNLLKRNDLTISPYRDRIEWDLTNQEVTYSKLEHIAPDIIYLAAYTTNVDACEDRVTDAMNIDACINIAAVIEQWGGKLVFISSSYVFGGNSEVPYTIDDDPMPINHYGIQKLTVEDYIKLVNRKYVIVRTVGQFGQDERMKSFPHQIIRAAQGGQKILVPQDQRMTPCHTEFFADILNQIVLDTDYRGVIHLSGDKSITKAQFAADIAAAAGVDADIIPVDSDVVKQVAKRPKMGSLDSSFITTILPNAIVPSYTASLRRFMEHG